MKLIQSMAVLAFGGVLLAGCNPDKDQADPMAEQDQSAAPAAPADMPPATDDTMAPPTDVAPGTPPPSPDATSPTDPAEEPPPPPNG